MTAFTLIGIGNTEGFLIFASVAYRIECVTHVYDHVRSRYTGSDEFICY